MRFWIMFFIFFLAIVLFYFSLEFSYKERRKSLLKIFLELLSVYAVWFLAWSVIYLVSKAGINDLPEGLAIIVYIVDAGICPAAFCWWYNTNFIYNLPRKIQESTWGRGDGKRVILLYRVFLLGIMIFGCLIGIADASSGLH